MRLPDPQRSRAVLIGTGRFADKKLPDLPVVGRTIGDLAAALSDPVRGVVAKTHCTVLEDQGDIRLIGRHLRSAARDAEDLLLVYFVGHGLVGARRHELYLGLPDSEWAEPEFNSLEYDKVRSSILDSAAATKIIILDCCFSGRVVSEAMADPVTEMVGQIEVDGTYVLASAERDQVALILPGEDHTAFTGRFLHLIRNGVPGGPELLTVDYLYRQLVTRMRAEGLSQPQKRATSTADLLALAVNRAFAGAQTSPVRTLLGPPVTAGLRALEVAHAASPVASQPVPDATSPMTFQPIPVQEQAFRPWAELDVPAGLSNLPRPGLFVGRESELARLDAALAGPGGVVVQAVHGLGGVGKSTLAARWAAAHASDYKLTWWITAATPADIDAGLAALAAALQPALTGVLPLEALQEGAMQWLAAHPGWLVILDNVTDPADVTPLLAWAPAGRYLITSRRASGWHGTAVPVRLDVLDPAEAQDLLAAILSLDRPQDADGAAELCAELGYLPLAIEQAGAYLAQADATPREYLDLLARYPADIYQAAAEGGDAARTIARIWRVTVDRLADDPLAGQVLRILAWYAPDAIPRTLLDGLASPSAVMRAVGRLTAYSMLTLGAGTVAMHRLVQAVTRTADPGDPHRDPQAIDAARDQATRRLTSALPDWQDPAGWPGWRMLLPHIDALASHAPPDADTQYMAYLFNLAGVFLDGQGQPGRAAEYFQRALAGYARVLGADHPYTLATGYNLASAYRAAGDLGRAIPLFEQTLADRERVLGADHPDTLTSRNNLAVAYQAAEDLGRAIPLFEQTLADRERVLGADHPDTLGSRRNLAVAYGSAGDLGRAIPLLEQTLADNVRALGDDHPQTKIVRGDLAVARQRLQ